MLYNAFLRVHAWHIMNPLSRLKYKNTVPPSVVKRIADDCFTVAIAMGLLDHLPMTYEERNHGLSHRALTFFHPTYKYVETVPLSHDVLAKFTWPADRMTQRLCYVTQFDDRGRILFELYFQISEGAPAKVVKVVCPNDQEVEGRVVERQIEEWPEAIRRLVPKE